MKILKTFLLFLAFISAGNSFGQTKEETIAWLKEKFDKYAVGKSYKKATVKDVKLISIDACQFSFSSIYKEEADGGTPHHVTTTFPTDIIGITETGYFNYGGSNDGYEIEKVVQIMDGTKKYREASYAMVQFHFDGEENLRERMEKALKHLATFCPKKKETF